MKEDDLRIKRIVVLLTGLLCIIVLAVILMTNGPTKHSSSPSSNTYDAELLFKYKTAFVGDNSKVVNLINNLPYADLLKGVSLETKEKPYGITVKYDLSITDADIGQIEATFRDNAIIMFALIDNVDVINFNLNTGSEERKYQYTREQLQQSFDKDLREYAKDMNTLEDLIKSIALKLFVYPEKYAMTMSSTPGICISAQYNGTADKVKYSTTYGKLLAWDKTTGKINEYGQNAEVSLVTPVYWSPPGNDLLKNSDKISIKATALNQGATLTEKQVNIKFDSSTHLYTVEASPDVIIAENRQTQSQNQKPIIVGNEPQLIE